MQGRAEQPVVIIQSQDVARSHCHENGHFDLQDTAPDGPGREAQAVHGNVDMTRSALA